MAAREIVPKVGRWMYKQAAESVSDFVARLPPSRTSVEATPWICAHYQHETWEPPPVHPRMEAEFDAKVTPEVLRRDEERKGPNQIDMESVVKLFTKYNYVLGKWVLVLERDEVDEVWEAVCDELFTKGLGCGIAKVSPAHPESDTHALCIYTLNYLNTWDVKRTAYQIRKNLNISEVNLKYKPEAATQLDLYCENERWGPRPTTIYVSVRGRVSQPVCINRRAWDIRRTVLHELCEANVMRNM